MSKPAQVSAVAMDPNHKVPVVLLKIEDDERFIPIWIGLLEASAILVAIEGADVPRPMTHDLACAMLDSCGGKITQVEVVDLRDGTYYAEITLEQGTTRHVLDARPSDALAIALRSEAPILVHDRVLEKVQAEDEVAAAGEGVEGALAGEEGVPTPSVVEGADMDEEEMKRLLERLDPDDFKYKM